MYTSYSSQKCESVNSRISQVAPKDRTYSGTTALLGRVAYVVVIDSIRYKEGLKTICGLLGFELPKGTTDFLEKLDGKRESKAEYQRREEVIVKRGEELNRKIRVELLKKGVEIEIGVDYTSGVAMDMSGDESIGENGTNESEPKKGNWTSTDCGVVGHKAGWKVCKSPDPERIRRREERKKERIDRKKREDRRKMLEKFAVSDQKGESWHL